MNHILSGLFQFAKLTGFTIGITGYMQLRTDTVPLSNTIIWQQQTGNKEKVHSKSNLTFGWEYQQQKLTHIVNVDT